jgi:hypothetical protein
MVLTVSVLLKSIGLIILFFAVFFLVGQLITIRRIRLRPFDTVRIFEALFNGMLMVVSLFAIVQTAGRTVLLPVPVLLLIFNHNKAEDSRKTLHGPEGKSALLFMLALGLLFYFVYYLQAFINFNDNTVRYVTGDTSFYARLGDYLNDLGRENSSIDYLFPSRFNTEPYHYWDIWFGAMASATGQMNPHFSLVLIVYPILAFLFSLGIYVLAIDTFATRSKWTYLAFLGALFSGLVIFYPRFLLKSDIYAVAPSYYAKTLVVGLFLVWCLINIRNKNWNRLIVGALIAGLGYINIAPPLFFALFIFIVFMMIVKKEIKLLNLWPGFISGIVLLAYLYYFYHNTSGNIEDGVDHNLRTSINILVGGSFQLAVVLPFLLIFAWAKNFQLRQWIKTEYIFLALLPVCGLISWAFLWNRTNEAVQFFYVLFIPFCAIIIGLGSVWVFSNRVNIICKAALGLLLAAALIQNGRYDMNVEEVSKKDYQNMERLLASHGKGYFVNLRNMNEFTTYFSTSTMVYRPHNWCSYLDRNYQNFSLNAPYIQLDSNDKYPMMTKSLIHRAPFSYFVNHQNGGSVESLRQQFIRQNKIKYLSLSPLADYPADLHPLFQDSLKLESGWRIYYLSNP